MTRSNSCLLCGGSITAVNRCVVAPFVSHRTHASGRSDLLRCESCDLSFYAGRLNEAEHLRLYRDYRSEEYQKERNRFEPLYTAEFNDRLGDYERRGRILAKILKAYGLNDSRSVLDVGGGSGELTVGINGMVHVYEVGEHVPPGLFDLVVISHVLEHVSDPVEFLKQFSGKKFYIEVPLEPKRNVLTRKRLKQFVSLCLERPKVAWSVLKHGTIWTMHEHINRFSGKSLDLACSKAGLKVIHSGSSGNFWVIAEPVAVCKVPLCGEPLCPHGKCLASYKGCEECDGPIVEAEGNYGVQEEGQGRL